MDKSMVLDTVTKKKIPFRNIAAGEPEWIYDLRKRAWQNYLSSPPPERTSNVWRYTDPSEFEIENPSELFGSTPVIIDSPQLDLKKMSPEHSAFGYNKTDLRTYTQLNRKLSDSGVIFRDLYSATRENRDPLNIYFGKLIDSEFGRFEALNMALWTTGIFLYVPSNLIIEKPIYLHRHPTGKYTFARLLVVMGDNAQATIIDDYYCHHLGKYAVANSAVELFAGDSSNLRYVNLQRMPEDARTYITVRSSIGQSSNIKSIYGSTGSGVTKVNAGAILAGRGASSQMYGAIFGDAKQHFDYHTMQHHKASETFSNLNFKVVLKDKANSAYTGLIRIEKETSNCEAYQENRNLLLNAGTKADSIPELEILTDQVRCTHGATMGPIDPEQIFYLKSRGVAETEAVRIIVMGFMESLLGQIPVENSAIVRDQIYRKLGEGNNGTGIL